jgi:NitT/TauT family transport system substrate-binding protein
MTDTPARALFAWVLALTLLLGGCSPAPEPPLRVGTYPWPGFATLHHARALGRLDVDRVLLVDFDSAGEVMAAFREKRIDAAGLALNEALLMAREPGGVRVVLVFGESAGGDALLARPPIVNLRQLRGKRVGVEAEAEGAYVLARVLDRAGLKEEDIEVVDLPLDKHEQAYYGGEVEAVITMDPVRARLLIAGANELFSSKEIAGELVDVLLVRREVVATHPRALQQVVDAHFHALESIRDDPLRAAERLPRRFGPAPQVLWSWAMLNFSGIGANLRLLDSGTLRQNAALVLEAMRRRRQMEGGKTPQLELDARFVANAGA